LNSNKGKTVNLLVFTTLFPNAIQQRHGIFVKARLWQLLLHGDITATVIAPVPWFPFKSKIFGKYGEYARVSKLEIVDGVEVYHPRYLVIPKIGTNMTPVFLYWAAKKLARKLASKLQDVALIDAHYCYPDGVAAAKLAKTLNKPLIITARGSDINLIPDYAKPKKMIAQSFDIADGIITVSGALKEKIVGVFGVNQEQVRVLRNGVDTVFFKPLDRGKCRIELGLHGDTLLSVGNLVDIKGHDLAIKAVAQLPDVNLLIAGDGPDRAKLEQLCLQLGVQNRVVFLGVLSQEQLIFYYNVADALLLLSSHEGLANVLLESIACGTPVIASSVGGTPEIVRSAEAGILLNERTVESAIEGINHLFNNPPEREDTRRYAEKFSWDETTQGQCRLFDEVISKK